MNVVAKFAFVGVVVSTIAAALHVFLVCGDPSQPNMVQWLIVAGLDLVLAGLFGVLGFLAWIRPKERSHEPSRAQRIYAC